MNGKRTEYTRHKNRHYAKKLRPIKLRYFAKQEREKHKMSPPKKSTEKEKIKKKNVHQGK